MEFKEVLIKRRSVRKFQNKEVEDEKIEQLIRAAQLAPSAANKRAWEFFVVTNKAILEDLRKATKYSNYQANLAIIICCNKESALKEEYFDYWIEDCSAACENLLLQAVDLGLASCWCGVYPQKENIKNVTKILNLEEKYLPLNLIYLGYPLEEIKPKVLFEKEKIHYLK